MNNRSFLNQFFKTAVCRGALGAILICVCLGGLAAQAVETAPETAVQSQLIKPGEVPAGLDTTAWAKIQDQFRAGERSFQEADNGSFSARNNALALKMQARLAGFEVSFNDQPGLNFQAVAIEDAVGALPLPAVAPVRAGNKVEYRKGPVTEWYLNRADGVEQGFTIFSASDGSPQAPKTTALLLRFGDELTCQVAPAGDKAVFNLKTTGRPAYCYEGLKAWDANGREMKARMEERGQRSEVRGQNDKSKIQNRK